MIVDNKTYISIIVPVYNEASFLEGCLNSVMNQDFRDFEVILIDDGSTDASGEICDAYANKDGRISVIHQKNAGSVEARRNGLAAANGQFVGFVDADDFIEPDMYEILLERMEETKADFVQIRMFGDGNDRDGNTVIEVHDDNRAEVISQRLFRDISISSNLHTKLFKTKELKEAFAHVPSDQQYGEDMLCILHYMNSTERICLCERELYHYRIVEDSISHKSWDHMCVESTHLFERMKDLLVEYKLWDKCRDSAELYYRNLLLYYLRQSPNGAKTLNAYHFNGICSLQNKRIVLYGAGKVGTDYYKQIVCNEKQEIVAWIDRNPVGSAVKSPDCLKKVEYDYILIAVAKEEVANEIREYLLNGGICDNPSKILWKKPERLW